MDDGIGLKYVEHARIVSQQEQVPMHLTPEGENPESSELKKLEKKEECLATKLKSLCASSGEENRSSLEDSADILVELGKIYHRKSILKRGTERKLSCVKCATLLQAAIERFKILNTPEKIQSTRKLWEDFLKDLCEISVENYPNYYVTEHLPDLCKITEKFLSSVHAKRTEIQKILQTELNRDGENDPNYIAEHLIPEKKELVKDKESISCIDIEMILTPDREEKEGIIVDKVNKINENVTTFYKGVMRDIAAECLKFLPVTPCKFSIVGLGSLAREEVTLYSDFEHIILLEDGIDKKENYQSVLEYFRWFSVVFQVIVIGFGETIIPSVAIKSLNDSYSADSNLNWFYDNYTRQGISFDGMLPHACKIPLGRQQTTENRLHVVELIKTPQKMAQYLTRKEQLKNGYHLADVLRETCLVYGDATIYDSFIRESGCIFERGRHNGLDLLEIILKNPVQNISLKGHIGEQVINSKPVIYRRIATYISVFARIHKIGGKPTFEIIEQLHKRGLLPPIMYRKLKYAFAVACEIRMKLYHKVNQQRHKTQAFEMVAIVGDQTLENFFEVMDCFAVATECLASGIDKSTLKRIDKIYTDVNSILVISQLTEYGFFEEAIRRADKFLQNGKLKEHEIASIYYAQFTCCHHAGVYNSQCRLEYFRKAESLYLRLRDREYELPAVQMCEGMAEIYYNQGRLKECMAVYEKFFAGHFWAMKSGFYNDAFTASCYLYYYLVHVLTMSPSEADEKLKTVLWDTTDTVECQLLKWFHFIHRSVRQGDNDEDTKRELRLLSAAVRMNTDTMVLPGRLYSMIACEQIRMWQLEDAAATLESATEYHRTRTVQDKDREFDLQDVSSMRFLCLCRKGDTATSGEAGTKTLLQQLVKMLIRGIIHSNSQHLLVVLFWIINLKLQGKIHAIFLSHQEMKDPRKMVQKANRLVRKFTEDYCSYTAATAVTVSYAMLLLANLL